MRHKKAWAGLVLAGLLLTLAGAAAAQSAVVDNGSDLEARLNLREAPDKNAASLGRFYSGTQVEIVADVGDGWAQVTIGTDAGSVSGYMLAAYLKSDATHVQDATEAKQVASPYGTPCVVLRNRPSNSYEAVSMLSVGDSVQVIGTSGEFYYVRTQDDTVGCLAENEMK